MTAPSGEPGLDPTTPPVNPAPAPGVPAPAPQPTAQPGLDPNAPVDVANLPANVQNLIAKARQEAAAARQGKTTEAQRATEATQRLEGVLKALGLNTDGSTATASPEDIAKQMQERAAVAEERAAAEADRAWGAEVKLQIHKLASKCGADPDALIDSKSFVDSLDDIADDDPSAPQFREALTKKIVAAVSTNPSLRAQRGAPARMGADITGSGGGNEGRPRNLREAFARQANGS